MSVLVNDKGVGAFGGETVSCGTRLNETHVSGELQKALICLSPGWNDLSISRRKHSSWRSPMKNETLR